MWWAEWTDQMMVAWKVAWKVESKGDKWVDDLIDGLVQMKVALTVQKKAGWMVVSKDSQMALQRVVLRAIQ